MFSTILYERCSECGKKNSQTKFKNKSEHKKGSKRTKTASQMSDMCFVQIDIFIIFQGRQKNAGKIVV